MNGPEKLNDKWLLIFGIPLISLFDTFVLFRFLHDEGNSYLTILVVCVVLISAIWEADRIYLIQVRRKFPGTPNLVKRSVAQVIYISITLVVIGWGGLRITEIMGVWQQALGFDFYLYMFAVGLPIAIVVTCIYELIYYFHQWQQSFILTEILKKENLQVQLDSLKNQVNPHFLFNSLNALSNMIDTDAELAKQYVLELAVVYRNILDSNEKELNTLREELEVIQAYFFLLHTRFGAHLKEEISIPDEYLDCNIPPLTLQMLVENAVKHNAVSASKPLTIKIYSNDGNVLIVSNNLQKIQHRVTSNKVGLENIKSKYRLLNQVEVEIQETSENFEVILPLIKPPYFAAAF